MSLEPCRACGHQVDTSALACPGCGATDPAKSISRQQRNARNFAIQLIVILVLLGYGGWYVWSNVVPVIKQFIAKPQSEQSQSGHPSETR
ncbi:hypothetical protein [Propionivibrio sp.]|uniref:hypothetical protein n=1 Tax=Propionivibrio sp. TaxID=2212460 RepID=UPI0025F95965|nr:hypothetical protein [Propionivibrio sp.]MBK7355901.1 hypothetical protein [Propionivibrio sp.]MBK8400438.1 hypothetical protein [Propionivibrio sp.]MBK8746058.1 hypothetical protein [Propionivibrio sp.]MBK8895309.1 hypothetical protein [Propionivibrio sp.]